MNWDVPFHVDANSFRNLTNMDNDVSVRRIDTLQVEAARSIYHVAHTSIQLLSILCQNLPKSPPQVVQTYP